MTSKVQAWNMALARIRSTANVQDAAENSAEARYCALYHDEVLNWLLEEGQWNFAKTSRALSDTGTTPTNWAYQYHYPSDCLRPLEIVTADRQSMNTDPLPFDEEIIDSSGAKVIVCDVAAAELKFIKKITDFTLLNHSAVAAFVEMLASYIASPLAKDEKMKDDYYARAVAMLNKAKGANKNRVRRDRSEYSTFVAERE